MDRSLILILAEIMIGNCQDPIRTGMDRGRKRIDQTDPPIAIPVPLDWDRRKEQRKRRRGHYVFNGQRGLNAAPAWLFPVRLIVSLVERDRISGTIRKSRQDHGGQVSPFEIVTDPRQRSVAGPESFFEKLTERIGIDHPPQISQPGKRTNRQLQSDPQGTPQKRETASGKHIVESQPAPERHESF